MMDFVLYFLNMSKMGNPMKNGKLQITLQKKGWEKIYRFSDPC